MMTTMFPMQKAGFEFWVRLLDAFKIKLPAAPASVQKRRFEDGGPCRGVRIKK